MPCIDRRLRTEGPRIKKKSAAIASTAIAALFITSFSMLLINTDDSTDSPTMVSYKTHYPILINNSADFAYQAALTENMWPGNGSEESPYVIEGLNISASTAHGIYIKNTNAHFIVRDCYIHGGGASYNGIFLSGCRNGTLVSNVCSNNRYSIAVGGSAGNILINNICSNNDLVGIGITSSSHNNTLMNNTCSVSDFGIYISVSNDNILINNTCSGNSNEGLSLSASCHRNILTSNTCTNNVNDGIFLGPSCRNNSLINNSCTNNNIGIWVGYTDNLLYNNNCSNNDRGIAICGGARNTLIGNNASNNSQFGMVIYYPANNNTISYNRISNNGGYGVYIYIFVGTIPKNNTIWNNTLVGNNGGGIQGYDDGVDNHWNSSSGYGNYWSDLTGPDNEAPYGIVDWSYNLTGTANATDLYPLTDKPSPPMIPEFSDVLIPMAGLTLVALLLGRGRKWRAR